MDGVGGGEGMGVQVVSVRSTFAVRTAAAAAAAEPRLLPFGPGASKAHQRCVRGIVRDFIARIAIVLARCLPTRQGVNRGW